MSYRIHVQATLGTLELDVTLTGGSIPLALLGPNGSGKTTLLRLIAGAHRPRVADIEIDGEVLCSTERGIHVPIEARGVAYVPQGYGLFPHLSAVDNVAFGLAHTRPRVRRAKRRERALQMLDSLDARHLAARLPGSLSGGERQRVALARALVIEPRILLLDEPLSALDAAVRRRVRSFLSERVRALGRPTILVTHDLRDVRALGAHVAVLEGGRIVQQGSLESLYRAPASEFVAELLDVDGEASPPAVTRRSAP